MAIAADCKSAVSDIGGSSPSTPTPAEDCEGSSNFLFVSLFLFRISTYICIMTKKEIINKIEDSRTWDTAKHRYAEKLLNEYNGGDVRDYLWNKFRNTQDYFYCKLLKDNP